HLTMEMPVRSPMTKSKKSDVGLNSSKVTVMDSGTNDCFKTLGFRDPLRMSVSAHSFFTEEIRAAVCRAQLPGSPLRSTGSARPLPTCRVETLALGRVQHGPCSVTA